MKIKSYFLASLAASFAFVACNKSDVEPNKAQSLDKTSVTLSLEDKSANSKTSITPNSDEDATLWSVEWQKDDMIGGWCADSYTPFVMESMTDGKTATFTGEAADKDALRFIYPYSATAVSGSTYTVDLGVQTSDPYYVASSNKMVMVSEPAADYFKTKTALIDVKFDPASYIPNSKVINFEISGDAISSTATLDLSAADAEFVGAGNGTIAATVVDAPTFNISNQLTLSVAAVPFVLAPGESITVKVLMNTADVYEYPYAGNVKYTFTKTNNTSEDMVFGAGMRSTILIDDLGEDSDNEPVKVEGFLGEGTEGNPYLISTREDLLAIGALVTVDLAGSFDTASDNNCKGQYFKLTNDIDLDGQVTAIGVANKNEFRGVFDGDGHTISNNTNYLFGGIYADGVVKNLTTFFEHDYSPATMGTNYNSVAGIAFYNSGLIQNCVSKGTLSLNAYGAGISVYLEGGSIVDCVNYMDIIGANTDCGGIISYFIMNAGVTTNRIINCANLGTITQINTAAGAHGGIYGRCIWQDGKADPVNSLVSNCYNGGKMVGNLNGPIGGNNNAVMKNCYYVEGCLAETSTFGVGTTCTMVSEAEMKSAAFVTKLSEGAFSDSVIEALDYDYCAWSNIEGFYPTPLSGVAVAEAPAAIPAPVDAWSTKASVNYGGGRGTETYPYMITSAAELAHFAASYDTDCYYRLAADINLAGYIWASVSADAEYLLDMAGYSISNIYMNDSYENDSIFE